MKQLISVLVLILTLSACATSNTTVTLPVSSPEKMRVDRIAKQICPTRTVICGIPLIVYDQPVYNASTNGLQIVISYPMVNLTLNDGQLAFILSHEIYNIMKMIHEDQYSEISAHELEFRADVGGLMIMYCSGFDAIDSIGMLERFANTISGRYNTSVSHPSMQRRIDNLKQVKVDEIKC